MPQSVQYTTRIVPVDRVAPVDAQAWSALEARALEPNAYLSPHFVLPAARHLTPELAPQVFFVERVASGLRQLVGVGIFTEAGPTRKVPLRRLVGYRSRHSFLSGLLLDREHAAPALAALMARARRVLPRCNAIEIPRVWSDGPLAAPAGAAERSCRFRPRISEPMQRSVLLPLQCEEQLRVKPLSRQVADLDRRMRRLRERGSVEWRWHREDGIGADVVESFLALEHMGWKGDGGSSLRAQPHDEAFFREMIAGFASERRVLFTEVAFDGAPIASRCFLLSGRAGFYFKLGWNPEFRSYSPALLNEVEFMRHVKARCGDIDYFDSGAGPDAFINELWPSRRSLATLTLPTGRMGTLAIEAVDSLRLVKQHLRSVALRPRLAGPTQASA